MGGCKGKRISLQYAKFVAPFLPRIFLGDYSEKAPTARNFANPPSLEITQKIDLPFRPRILQVGH